MINREQAQAIASRALQERGLSGTIRNVLLGDEITGQLPVLYGVPLDDCWIAYVERADCLGVQSSLVVVIGRQDGAIRYCGCANDEG